MVFGDRIAASIHPHNLVVIHECFLINLTHPYFELSWILILSATVGVYEPPFYIENEAFCCYILKVLNSYSNPNFFQFVFKACFFLSVLPCPSAQ